MSLSAESQNQSALDDSMWEAFADSQYLFGGNGLFIEEIYKLYCEDPSQVDKDWQEFFSQFAERIDAHSPSWSDSNAGIVGVLDPEEKREIAAKEKQITAQDDTAILHSIRALQLIHAYRVRGHLKAKVDPLNQVDGNRTSSHPELNPINYGFSREDYTKEIYLGGTLGKESATLNEILNILEQTYCQTIGVEFMHIQYPDQKAWIQERFEKMQGKPHISPKDKKEILADLIEVEAFEEFLQTKYPGMKRFSIQGGDAMVPGLQSAMHTASRHGVNEVVIGMPHRGRMNVLTNIMKKPYSEMFSLFHGNMDFPESVNSSGDVKYHIGVSADRDMPGGNLHLSLTANPSHLEAVNPVVCGKVRAKQDQKNDLDKSEVMGIQLHGDAAFAGQGVVPETLSLSELRGYRTGGSLHIIVNNQIGFTTSPKFSRFTPYPSDVAKMVAAPIFHVNGEDPEAVVYACRLATEFRQRFKRDVVVDIFCYRRYGHNEGDEPMFTQPLMYKTIKQKKSPARIYADVLVSQGVMKEADVEAEFARFNAMFEEQFEAAREHKPNKADWLEGAWSDMSEAEEARKRVTPETGVDKALLKDLASQLGTIPDDFKANSKVKRIIKTRTDAVLKEEGMDWAIGEHLAFATLLHEGYGVRLSGQDSRRGTFSHRHSVFVDQENENRYTPLNNLKGVEKKLEVIDSSLSEFAILGFEYGYSQAEPNALTIWEAQFGDFANGAQIMIDQFIASGEIKWLRMSGLVMLLPHGYEGQGPEHSSARLERFLQLCGEDNMQVVNCTTPANFFHCLRRQLHRNFRKPLVVMSPKSLLRHKRAVSTLDDFATDTSFTKVYAEVDDAALVADKDIKKVILTSGKVYYDLLQAREEHKVDDIAIVRVEQYYPYPHHSVQDQLKRYPNAEVVWVQEEPKNMGAWMFIESYIEESLSAVGRDGDRPRYVGRRISASPAVGYLKIHELEQQALVAEALGLAD